VKKEKKCFFASVGRFSIFSDTEQNRAQTTLLYLLYDKESDNIPTRSAELSNQTLFSKRVNVSSALFSDKAR